MVSDGRVAAGSGCHAAGLLLLLHTGQAPAVLCNYRPLMAHKDHLPVLLISMLLIRHTTCCCQCTTDGTQIQVSVLCAAAASGTQIQASIFAAAEC
jgi:hypothetical protein